MLWRNQGQFGPLIAEDVVADPKSIVIYTFPSLLCAFGNILQSSVFLRSALNHIVILNRSQNFPPKPHFFGLVHLSHQSHALVDHVHFLLC